MWQGARAASAAARPTDGRRWAESQQLAAAKESALALSDDGRVLTDSLNKGEMARDGNNQVLACDPATGKVRRFLTGPVNCALTGATWTPDGRTMFVNIQHPGEMPTGRNDPGRAAPQVQLARLPPALPAALGDAGDPQGRGRGDRDLRAAG